MDATSRRICLTGVLKMNSFRDSFLFSPFSSPYFLLFGHGCRLLFPRLRRNETRNGRTVMALVNDIDRHCLYRCVNEKRFFSTSNAPVVLFPFLVSLPPLLFPSLFPSTRGEGRRTSGAEVETAARKNGASRRKLLLAPFNFKVNRGRPTYLP